MGEPDTVITSCFTKQNKLGDKGEAQVACCGNPEQAFGGRELGRGLLKEVVFKHALKN